MGALGTHGGGGDSGRGLIFGVRPHGATAGAEGGGGERGWHQVCCSVVVCDVVWCAVWFGAVRCGAVCGVCWCVVRCVVCGVW